MEFTEHQTKNMNQKSDFFEAFNYAFKASSTRDEISSLSSTDYSLYYNKQTLSPGDEILLKNKFLKLVSNIKLYFNYLNQNNISSYEQVQSELLKYLDETLQFSIIYNCNSAINYQITLIQKSILQNLVRFFIIKYS